MQMVFSLARMLTWTSLELYPVDRIAPSTAAPGQERSACHRLTSFQCCKIPAPVPDRDEEPLEQGRIACIRLAPLAEVGDLGLLIDSSLKIHRPVMSYWSGVFALASRVPELGHIAHRFPRRNPMLSTPLDPFSPHGEILPICRSASIGRVGDRCIAISCGSWGVGRGVSRSHRTSESWYIRGDSGEMDICMIFRVRDEGSQVDLHT